MGKRKREVDETVPVLSEEPRTVFKSNATSDKAATVQIITGSYERVLHGFTATVLDAAQNDSSFEDPVQFSDNFLFNAHASAIKCLAISPVGRGDPSQPQKVILASGGTDERVNLYNLSVSAPSKSESLAPVPTLAGKSIAESSKNRELGSLLHHTSSITALHFPSRSKLLSAAEDNTITVTRVRDWTVVSTIKVPQPKVQGRPSGDTAPFGAAPTGVNDFAVHPSMKLMVSVGKGEKCMRLWNLVTGKKAGVLNFGKDILQGVGEGRWGSGEGRKIQWNGKGDQYAVSFERGAVIFGMVRLILRPSFIKLIKNRRIRSQYVDSSRSRRRSYTASATSITGSLPSMIET
jgi:protein MAK11